MNNDNFLLTQRIEDIANQFIDKGWVTIYNRPNSESKDLIFCCLLKAAYTQEYLEDRNWRIEPGREGKPAVIVTFEDEKENENYYTNDDENLEPFLFYRHFSHIDKYYVDLSEEFVLYWRLYEDSTDKLNRTYTFFDDYGEKEDVVIITPYSVRVKYKFLLEYISVRKMDFAIVFDFERWEKGTMEDHGAKALETDYKTSDSNYNHLFRYWSDSSGNSIESWIRGKVIIRHEENVKSYHGEFNSKHESYITGIDKYGNEILHKPTDEIAEGFIVVCFKREVLDKYYNKPSVFQVDGFDLKAPAYSMRIDNNHMDHISIFLKDLRILPYNEQLHWKHHNIVPPEKGALSEPFFTVMIEGSWAKTVGRPDNYFKQEYLSFNKAWEKKMGWPFYLPLKGTDSNYFTSLHIPSTDNIKTFTEQILALAKLTIDSLNEAKLSENIIVEEKDRGIIKLEKFLALHDMKIPDMTEFLRHLQSLRTGIAAHRFSENNTGTQKAIEYFGISDETYIKAASEIFIKSVYTLNMLSKRFLIPAEEE